MALEPEPEHTVKLLFLFWAHGLRTHFLIGDVVGGRTGLSVFILIRIVFLAGIAEQRQSVVKNGGGRNDVAAVVIPQDAEVSKVAVLVVNQGIKHQHAADFPRKLQPQLVIVGKASGNAPTSGNVPDGDIGPCRC